MTSLEELLKNLRGPTVVKITQGNLDIPQWRTFGLGKCVTIFPPAKQIIVLNPSCYENMDISGSISDVSHRMENIGFLNSETSQKFYDTHCEDVTYTDTSKLAKDFPRYIKPNADFFTFSDDETMCSMYKVTAGQVLECYEVEYDHSCDDDGMYGNIRGPMGEILRCRCKESNTSIVLPYSLKVSLLGISDRNHYSITEISERFAFPRKVTFCNDSICQSMKRIRGNDTLMAASVTNDEMLFLCELGKTNIELYDESLLQCKDVVMIEVGNLNIADVLIEVVSDTPCDILERFESLYSKKQTSTKSGLTFYTIYGTEANSSLTTEKPFVDEDTDDENDDYLDMSAQDCPPPIPRKTASPNGADSRSPSIRSSTSSRSSGSDADHGGSYIHIIPTTASDSTSVDSSCKHNIVEPVQHPSSSPNASLETMASTKPKDEAAHGTTEKLNATDDIMYMGVAELCEFLRKYKLHDLGEVCESEMIDGEFITSLSDDELRNEPILIKEFDLIKFKRLKDGWRPKL